jgi:hypothetical protein
MQPKNMLQLIHAHYGAILSVDDNVNALQLEAIRRVCVFGFFFAT